MVTSKYGLRAGFYMKVFDNNFLLPLTAVFVERRHLAQKE